MKSAVTVSLVPQAKGGPFVFWEGLPHAFRCAADAGFHAVEIFPPSATALDLKEIQTLSMEYGVQVAAIGTGGGWLIHQWHLCHEDAAIRHQAREFISEIIQKSGACGAPTIIGSMQGRSSPGHSREQTLELLAEALAELSRAAKQTGQPLLYEPLNRYETNLIHRLSDAAAFLEKAGLSNVKLLADLFHMNIEEASMPVAIRAAHAWIGHVHFADSNRRAVGFGHSEVDACVEALRDIGYSGYLSAEILPLPDSLTAAKQTASAFQRLMPS